MLILLEVINIIFIIYIKNCNHAYYIVIMLVEPISCISSTQDNMCTLVSCTDSTLKLMDRQKGELLNEYEHFSRF